MGFMEEDNFRDNKGRLLPGHGGLKPKGASNKLQGEIKEKITEFLAGKLESIEEVYDLVSAKDKLRFLGELLGYVLPKSKEIISSSGYEPRASIDYSKLSEATLSEILANTTISENGTE